MRPLFPLLLALTLAACNQPAPDASQETSRPKPDAAAAPQPPPEPAADDTGKPEDAAPGAKPTTAGPADAEPLAPPPAARGRRDDTAPDADRPVPQAAAPEFSEITVPSGTALALELDTALASDASQPEDTVHARLRRPLVIDGVTAAPTGTPVTGLVTAAERSGKVKGRASLAFRFTSLRVGDERYDIRTSTYAQQARATKRKDAATIGVPAAGGALIGAIVGGRKGAAIGGVAGGGAGTAVVMSTRGEEVRLPAGTPISVRLLERVDVRVPLRRN